MSDDELPINYVAPRLRESDVFCMPSADILASQRAREKELRQLASQHEEQGDMSVRLGSGSRDSQSSSSESESSLAAAVDALEVGAAPHEPAAEPHAAPDAADIVAALAIQLVHYDTQFLSLYLELLQSTNDNLINAATNEISSNIEVAVADALQTGCVRSEREVAVLVSWLCAATVWTGPRVPAARSLLQAILATATTEFGTNDMSVEEGQAAEAAGRALGAAVRRAGALVRAADAARGSAPAAARLADALLRAALDRLAPERRGEGGKGGEEREGGAAAVCARLGGAWRGLDAPERHAALQLVGRAPHLHQAGPRAALREWLARAAQPAPGHHRHSPDYLKILVGASKLQILFKVMETKNIYNEGDDSKNNK